MWRKPDLRQTEEAVQERRTRIQAELGLQTRKNDLDTAVERQRPTETEQRNAIDDYRAYQRIQSELDIMESYAGDYQDTIDDLEAQEAKDHPDEYRPREHFNDEFIHAMGDHARQILRECHYTPLTRAGFELKSFDITVNGEDKTRSHGKGYHSYLNTALMLTLRRYLAEHPPTTPESPSSTPRFSGWTPEKAPTCPMT